MKKYNTVIIAAIALAVGFGAGHFQASHSWEQKLDGDFYTQSGGEAFFLASALTDLRSGDKDAGLTLLEQRLDLSLARVEPVPTSQRDTALKLGISKARGYRLEHPWHGGSISPAIQDAANKVLASAQ